ncbi:MAG TPA: sugar ABC transporter ATP-binding protein [Geminicoccaceae bacterium]|nr:sugar ABC transporter ATP-binding protein [Geminicoccaceae bacterium]
MELRLRAGEVTALLGENGAGKSTLVKILTGIYHPDAGLIRIDGTAVRLGSPSDAWRAGITAIHQETVMFDELTVTENIFMGHPILRAPRLGLLDRDAMRARAAELLARLEVAISPDAKLKDLSIAQRHIVEVARALSHEARIVIMDEPTAALSRAEIQDLFKIVRQLRAAGKAVLFISHKLDEVFQIADRYTVFRDGRFVGEGEVAAVSEPELIRLMVGRELEQIFPKVEVPLGEVALEVEDLSHPTEFDGVSFTLRRGEILGFYGLVGAGRSEVMQAIFGITRPSRGRIRVEGEEVRITAPRDAIRAGITYVPEERQRQGAVLPLSIKANITLPFLDRVARWGFLDRGRELEVARRYGERLDVRAAAWEQRLEELSGGNQQKVVIGKWLATEPRIVILDEPTKGIDVGSKAAVHGFMTELVQQGLAVILVTSELPEALGMADRIVVMYQGRVRARFERADATPEAVVAAAIGSGGVAA